MGIAGERLARWYLESKGLAVVATNVVVDGGEIDLVVRDRSGLVAVEVRTRIGGPDPVDAADQRKRDHASRLARQVGAVRSDLIGIRLDRRGFDIHWVPAA